MLYYPCKIPPFFSKNKAFTPYAFSNPTGSLNAEKGREISPLWLAVATAEHRKAMTWTLIPMTPAALAVTLE